MPPLVNLKRVQVNLGGKNKSKSFITPARFGWGKVASELYPSLAKVMSKVSIIMMYLFKQIRLGPLGGRLNVEHTKAVIHD